MNRLRIRQLTEGASELGLEAVVLSSPENIRYFSGFTGEGVAVVSKGLFRIVTDSRYMEQAENQADGFGVIDIGQATHAAAVIEVLREAGIRKAGFEDEAMTVGEHRRLTGAGVDFEGIGALCERIRVVKDAEEIDAMRRAARLTDEGFEYILPFVRPGAAEYEIRAEMDYFFARRGGTPAFPMIVASGPNGSMPHAIPRKRKILAGDMVTLDFGASVDGYVSDMTRTVAVGQPDAALRTVYGVVLAAQRAAEDAARAGISGRTLDAVAREIIGKAGYGGEFGHGLGHGVGLQVHEQPRLSPRSGEDPLRAGMIVTIEPGVYLPGLGGVRIENTCLIREDGCEPLFAATRELIIL
jgi:Xaa-Pro aminopeptidase